MKAIVGIVIIGALVNSAGTKDPGEVNIALETVVKFDKKDQTPGLSVIDKVGDALEKIKDNLVSRRNLYTGANSRRSNPQDISFTDFISKAAKILNDFEDNDLEDVFAVIQDESRRYLSRESVLQGLFGGSDVRRHLTEQIDVFGDVSANNLRRHLVRAIAAVEHKQKTGEKNDILDIGNLLYIGAAAKFRSALKNLERLQKTKDAHIEVVLKDTLRSLIFDHYSNLNDKIKRELIEMAKDYWRMYSKKYVKSTRASGLKTISVTNFSHRGRSKNRARLLKSQVSREHWNKSPRTSHTNKRYKSQLIKPDDREFTPDTSPKYTVKLRKLKNQEFTPADTELNKLNNISKPSFEMKKNPPTIINYNQKTSSEYSENEESDIELNKYDTKNETRPALSYDKTVLNTDHSKLRTDSAQSNVNSSIILVGGQNTMHINKTDLGSRPITEKSKKKYESDNSDSSEDTAEQQLTTRKSIAKFKSENSAVDEEDDVIKEKQSSVTSAHLKDIRISGEGLSIESFEDESTIEIKIMRKSNTQYPEASILKEMIHNIEKQINDVKEQVNYVKNLSVCTDETNKPNFKSARSDEKSTTLSKTKKNRHHAPDSDAIDRENEAFFNRYVIENVVTEKTASAFRTDDGAENNVTVTYNIKNETKTTASQNKIVKNTAILNETNVTMTLSTSTIKNVTESIRNITQIELNANNKTDINDKDAWKINVNKLDLELNEIDHTNTTKKYDEKYVSIPQILNFSSKYEIDDERLFERMSQGIGHIADY